MTPTQLKAARTILGWKQEDLADAAKVARATIHRYEGGKPVGEGQVRLMRYAVEAAGVILIPDGAVIEGTTLFDGVGMRLPATARPRQGDQGPEGT